MRFVGPKVGKYRTILLDPPWPERGGGRIKRGADRHYPLMSLKEIADLPIESLADLEGCHIYLWITNNYVPAAIRIFEERWNITYITMITWGKEKIGLGQYFRGRTEHALFGRIGMLPYKTLSNGKRAQGDTLITAPRGRHSRKPTELHEAAELVSYEPRIELFARDRREGWDIWGNEVNSDIQLEE